MDVRVDVPERLHFQVRHQVPDALHAVEQRRDDHHRPGRGRHRVELQARKPPRRDQVADHPLQQLNGQLTCRHGGQQRDEDQRGTAPAVPPGVEDGQTDQRAVPATMDPRYPGVAHAKKSLRSRCLRSGCQATLRSNSRRPPPMR